MSKLSLYNFFIRDNENTICFNGISRFVFALNQNEFSFLQKSLENLPEFQQKYPSYCALLEKNGFIVCDDLNEYDYIRQLNRQDVFSADNYRMSINPTLECNFKCWYCYESHPQGYMSDDIMKKIINHIKYIAERKKVRRLDLTWFGGEPLLYFNEIVYPVSKSARESCLQNGLSFSNHATTNASLINDAMIEKFKEIELESFQITIDGIKEEHDKIRNEKGNPSFDKILKNIHDLCRSNKRIHVLLRINYTNKTLKNIACVLDYIQEDIKNQISIGFHRIWQTFQDNIEQETKEQLFLIIDKFTQKGFRCSYPETFSERFTRCYADKFWHTEINYDGSVYKCTMDYSKKSQGKLLDNGILEWDKTILSSMYSQATFENEMCKDCKMLPICFGPCSRKMLEIQSCPNCLSHLCNMKTSEIGYENLILNYYKYLQTKYNKNENK